MARKSYKLKIIKPTIKNQLEYLHKDYSIMYIKIGFKGYEN